MARTRQRSSASSGVAIGTQKKISITPKSKFSSSYSSKRKRKQLVPRKLSFKASAVKSKVPSTPKPSPNMKTIALRSSGHSLNKSKSFSVPSSTSDEDKRNESPSREQTAAINNTSTSNKRISQILKEITAFQSTTYDLIPAYAFVRVVREITEDVTGGEYKFTALKALQAATEAYIVGLFEDSNLLANHAKRVTLFPKDIHLAFLLKGTT